MALRRKGKLYSRKKMRLIKMIRSWRRFVSGKEKYQAGERRKIISE